MAGNDTDEKDQPPTDRRLQRLRENEGQTAHSKDFVSAFTLLGLCVLLFFSAQTSFSALLGLFSGYQDVAASGASFDIAAYFSGQLRLGLSIMVPVMALAFVLFIFVSILDTKGIVVSAKNMSLKFDRLNPVEGIKKIFGLQGISQFLKSLFKTIIIVWLLYYLFVTYLNASFWSVECGWSCVVETWYDVLLTIVAVSLLLFIVFGIADIWISRALFRRDNRMSHADIKREQQEEYGTREVRQERMRLRRDTSRGTPQRQTAGSGSSPSSENNQMPEQRYFTVLSETSAVTLAYEAGSRKTPKVIRILSRGAYSASGEPSVMAPALADDIAKTLQNGAAISDRHFPATAAIMVRLGVNKD